MDKRVRRHFEDSIATKQAAMVLAPAIVAAAAAMTRCLLEDGKILSCGNGGSAADCQHFAAELVGRFERERLPLPAMVAATCVPCPTGSSRLTATSEKTRPAKSGWEASMSILLAMWNSLGRNRLRRRAYPMGASLRPSIAGAARRRSGFWR